MKTSEIEVGQDYAAGRSQGSSLERVTVLEVAVEYRGWTSYGLSGFETTKKGGVLVRRHSTEQWHGLPAQNSKPIMADQHLVLLPQHIIRPWSEQEEINAQAEKNKREREDRQLREKGERGALLAVLKQAGIPAGENIGYGGVQIAQGHVEQANRRIRELLAAEQTLVNQGRPLPVVD